MSEMPTPKPRHLLLRVVEWSAWMPQGKDANNPDMVLSKGETTIPTIPGERLMDVEIMNTGIKGEFDINGGDGQVHCYYVFQATFAGLTPEGSNPDGFICDQPNIEDSQKAVEDFKAKQRAEKLAVQSPASMPRDHMGKGGNRRSR